MGLLNWLIELIQHQHGVSFSAYQAGIMMPFIGMGDNLVIDYIRNRALLWGLSHKD